MSECNQFVAALPVCHPEKNGVTPSAAALRQRRYRQGAAYKAYLARKRQARAERKNRWMAVRDKYKAIQFDGRRTGPVNPFAGRLSQWEKFKEKTP